MKKDTLPILLLLTMLCLFLASCGDDDENAKQENGASTGIFPYSAAKIFVRDDGTFTDGVYKFSFPRNEAG